MFFKLYSKSFFLHNHQLIIHKPFSCPNVHSVIGPVEISVKEKNEILRNILTVPYNTMSVVALIHTFVQSKHSVSQFQPRSNLTPTQACRLHKNLRNSMWVLIPLINENKWYVNYICPFLIFAQLWYIGCFPTAYFAWRQT